MYRFANSTWPYCKMSFISLVAISWFFCSCAVSFPAFCASRATPTSVRAAAAAISLVENFISLLLRPPLFLPCSVGRILHRAVPMFGKLTVLDAEQIEIVVFVLLRRIGGIGRFALPNQHYVITLGECLGRRSVGRKGRGNRVHRRTAAEHSLHRRPS